MFLQLFCKKYKQPSVRGTALFLILTSNPPYKTAPPTMSLLRLTRTGRFCTLQSNSEQSFGQENKGSSLSWNPDEASIFMVFMRDTENRWSVSWDNFLMTIYRGILTTPLLQAMSSVTPAGSERHLGEQREECKQTTAEHSRPSTFKSDRGCSSSRPDQVIYPILQQANHTLRKTRKWTRKT